MKVFLSHSGEPSRSIAGALYEWLPDVIPEVKPFYSTKSLPPGGRWVSDIDAEFTGSIGIICLTPNNIGAPWINFEAGALSQALEGSDARVIPLLHQLQPSQVEQPLAQFNMKPLSESGVYDIVEALNAVAVDSRPEERLRRAFDRWWPDLATKIEGLPAVSDRPEQRKEREILEEILEGVREVRRRQAHDDPVNREVLEELRRVIVSGPVSTDDLVALKDGRVVRGQAKGRGNPGKRSDSPAVREFLEQLFEKERKKREADVELAIPPLADEAQSQPPEDPSSPSE